jgi:hypothetical protein
MQESRSYLLSDEDINDPFAGNDPQAAPVTQAAEKSERPRIVVRTAADALQPHPTEPEMVEGLLRRGDVGVPYGEGGSGKTYSIGYMGVCVAGGLPCLGRKTIQTKVLWIDQESGENRFGRRLAEILRGLELGPETPFYYVCYANFKMDNNADPVILRALIDEVGAGLVIIDALAEIMDGDENSKEEVQPVFNNLRWLADTTGAAILVIHHSNKAGGYRGSTVIKNAVDLLICVTKSEDDNIINFETEKRRDGEPQKWAAVATWLDGKFTMRPICNDKKKALSKSQNYVLEFLGEKPFGAPMSEIKDNADICSAKAAELAVYALTNMKKIKRTNQGGKGIEAIYAICEEELWNSKEL